LDGAQVGGRADGGEARHTGAGDEHLGRWNLACGGDLPVEEATESVGGLDHGTVAADAGHRGERVHLLRAGELARQGVDGQHGQLALCELLHELGVLCRPDEAHERAARLHQRDLLAGRGAHLEDDVRVAEQLRGTARDPGAGGLVGIVAEVGGSAGPGFYADREAQLDQFLDDVGDCGNTLLARKGLARHSDR
jgi:hypothetical protein